MSGDGAGAEVARAVVPSADEMSALGARLAAVLGAGDVLVLTGPLGAGKTTLVRGLGEALGVRGTVASPTFVIARTHPSLGNGPALIHVDAYRLASALELDDLDLDLDASVSVIEWGSEVVDAITDSWLELVIERPTGEGLDTLRYSTTQDGDNLVGRVAPQARIETPATDLDEPRTVTLRAFGPRWADFDASTVLVPRA
ncbi:tRNA (adenosine(37)-N6)-threonylcarbamoyltransferase complex ATPase subunit type 1 TsaE [Gulosibacter macacae]|uniref:tRNA threonylcarbamoyladenosine biosynthesis protein TsaE n=1 Tax=Gulosibacter macacae TaxID=2488791 RepID=A0A3P3W445_9MICO|nr:tRNA (adenosine(37)-N6)-threonylcarbamoyltransferase complex ATPase subunit type 1 TsaE [Gulosibacter macacae]RRJ87593.1 tRNA (adenosine(37)-N6)-threonylcarbamoyltransferase complex ATPase subunit type 1 TsaE [Gulosibacter macacae]